jgi:hypothetical protein
MLSEIIHVSLRRNLRRLTCAFQPRRLMIALAAVGCKRLLGTRCGQLDQRTAECFHEEGFGEQRTVDVSACCLIWFEKP